MSASGGTLPSTWGQKKFFQVVSDTLETMKPTRIDAGSPQMDELVEIRNQANRDLEVLRSLRPLEGVSPAPESRKSFFKLFPIA